MRADRAVLGILVAGALAGTPGRAQAPAAPEPPPAANPGAAPAVDDSIEITYRGKKIVLAPGQQPPELGESGWRIEFVPDGGARPAAAESGPSGPAPTASPPTQSQLGPGPSQRIDPATLAALVGLGVAVAAMASWHLVLEPRRRRRPLKQALQIIASDDRTRFSEAEDLLNRSLLAGLKRKDVADARFSLAYVRARLGRFEEAATVLGDLEKSGALLDQSAVYLLLWVHSRLKNHERVERFYTEYESLLDGVHDTRLIVGIAYLSLARIRSARKEVQGAMHYFNELRKLGVLIEEIPSHIDDHEVVMGTVALFEQNVDQGVKHFQAAIDAARQNGRPCRTGELGLLLCEWKRSQLPQIDKPLGELLSRIAADGQETDAAVFAAECSHCGRGYRLSAKFRGKRVKCKACRKQFEAVPAEPTEPDESTERKEAKSGDLYLNDDEILLRNARLWHAASLLFTWLTRNPQSGLADSDRTELDRRINAVVRIDPEMGDAHLIGGLVRYYFSRGFDEHRAACEMLQKAVDGEAAVPEVLQLLDREGKLSHLRQHSLTYFHQIATEYAKNGSAADELRRRFLSRMKRFSRFREIGEIDLSEGDAASAPSVENLQNRGRILRNRLSNIVRGKLAEADEQTRAEISGMLDGLDERTRSVAETVKSFEQAEFGLLECTGEFLFQDDEPAEAGGEKTNGQA